METTLYGYFRSSASWRVRIALHWKGIPFRTEPVHLLAGGGQQFSPAFVELNPMRELPALAIDGLVLSQSVAILEYLEETRPTPTLYPGSAAERATIRQLVECVNASIQPAQNLRVLKRLQSEFGADADARTAWAAHWIRYGFEGLERLLERTAGAYSFGDSVTAADLCLVPQVYNAQRFGVDLAAFPTIQRVDATLSTLDAFAASRPDVQIDAE